MAPTAMPRSEVLAMLRRAGLPQLIADAERELRDPTEVRQLEQWAARHGMTKDWMVSRMGGSP
jgi:hypothetical protein